MMKDHNAFVGSVSLNNHERRGKAGRVASIVRNTARRLSASILSAALPDGGLNQGFRGTWSWSWSESSRMKQDGLVIQMGSPNFQTNSMKQSHDARADVSRGGEEALWPAYSSNYKFRERDQEIGSRMRYSTCARMNDVDG